MMINTHLLFSPTLHASSSTADVQQIFDLSSDKSNFYSYLTPRVKLFAAV